MNNAVIVLKGRLLQERDKSVLMALESFEQRWIPRSVIEYEIDESGACVVHMQYWFAKQEGLL